MNKIKICVRASLLNYNEQETGGLSSIIGAVVFVAVVVMEIEIEIEKTGIQLISQSCRATSQHQNKRRCCRNQRRARYRGWFSVPRKGR